MHVHILTLFPQSVVSYLESSMMKRAQEKGLFQYTLHNLTDWTVRNTRRVDDRPYGGGAGTLLSIEPLTRAIRTIFSEYGNMRILYPSPRGDILDHGRISQYASDNTDTLLICGHYEGIDERIFTLFPIEEFSIGQYVLSSGELG
jgi:tRNA (guanine37-N1)-methyltransferase